jgi:methyltransferase-like protein/ubiquinone/menaquinone biosynthesis C-methylase UbiE
MDTAMTVRDDERAVRESYDRVPYPSSSNHFTHPDRLATLALLCGLEPAPPERCRVLELGCADGGNLIPMAIELPESRFTGIDLSPVQIDAGRTQAAVFGARNLELIERSILDVDESLGAFDYIVCHGVFSWVTAPVQEKILAICRANLAPHGVAYVSYNTYPGWHLRRMVRDMVRYHTRGVGDAEERMRRALELVRFLADTAEGAPDAHAVFLRSAREQFDDYRERPSYLIHEYLEETNAPLYFHEFAARAAAHGLQYLGEAEPELMEPDNLPHDVAERLREYAHDPIELEQYLDFVLNRAFRRTLLCHGERALDRGLAPERIRRLHVASAAKRRGEEEFTIERRGAFTVSHPTAKAMLATLAAAWPRALSFDELLFELDPGVDDAVLADIVHSMYWSGIVALHLAPPRCVNSVSTTPRATALARRQASAGLLVTNQRRQVLKLDDPIARVLLRHLDGTRTRDDLVRLLDAEVSAGRLDVSVDGRIPDPQRIPSVLQALVEHHLRKMAEYALLVG